MPVDYSKWDALELSDDSDIEVHPNVDKRSFIRAKQNQIHHDREQRKMQIAALKYERQINEALIQRISDLLNSLKAHAAEFNNGTRSPAEVAFAAVMESAANLKPQDDIPPPRPESMADAQEKLPTYSKMMTTLLDQVNQALDEKKVKQEDRYAAMLLEVQEHLDKVTKLQEDLHRKLDELEKGEARKITSDGIRTGFDSSHVNKGTDSSSSASAPNKAEAQVELLNPNFGSAQAGGQSSSTKPDGDDEEVEASPAGKEFAKIKIGSYSESLAFLSSRPEIVTEHETDGLLIMAFDAALEGKDELSRQYVHQGLLLQYCRALGRDGVRLFFKRITTKGHQARDVFFKDVQETYAKIKTRCAEINKQRTETGGVEQIQLHAVEPGTVITFHVPPADSEEPEVQESRRIYESLEPKMRKALETGSLEEVNKVLGGMSVDEAEAMVGKLTESGVLSLQQQIIDATTEEGKAEWKQLLEETEPATSGSELQSQSKYADDAE